METTLNFDNYLFRCSSLGKIMTGVKPKLTEKQTAEMDRLNGLRITGKITEKQTITLAGLLEKRDAPDELSKTVITYLEKIHKEHLFKRTSELRNKYCDKGIQVEEKSLTIYSGVNNGMPFYKNKERFYNEYITGEPDLVKPELCDFKSSWDYETFPFYETEITNDVYDWQLFGYEWLTKIQKSKLIYCLNDTPNKIIEDELRRLDWKESVLTIEGNVKKDKQPLVIELISSMLYTEKGLKEFCQQSTTIQYNWFSNFREVPEDLRVKAFNHSFDETRVEMVINQIKKCREYLNNLSLQVVERLDVVCEVA